MISKIKAFLVEHRKEIQSIIGEDIKIIKDFEESFEFLIDCDQDLQKCNMETILEVCLWARSKGLSFVKALNQVHVIPNFVKGKWEGSFFLGINAYKKLATRCGLFFNVRSIWEGDYADMSWNYVKLSDELKDFKSNRAINQVYEDKSLKFVVVAVSDDKWQSSMHEKIEAVDILKIRDFALSRKNIDLEKSKAIWDNWFERMVDLVALRMVLKRSILDDTCLEIFKHEDRFGIYQGEEFAQEVKKNPELSEEEKAYLDGLGSFVEEKKDSSLVLKGKIPILSKNEVKFNGKISKKNQLKGDLTEEEKKININPSEEDSDEPF